MSQIEGISDHSVMISKVERILGQNLKLSSIEGI
jgi:hypothetical protein